MPPSKLAIWMGVLALATAAARAGYESIPAPASRRAAAPETRGGIPAVVDRAAWTGTATFPDGTSMALQNSNGHFLPLNMAPGASCTMAVSGPGLLPGRTVILSCSCGGLVEGAVSAEVAVDASGVLRFAYRSGTFGSQPIETTLMGQRRPLLTVHAVQTRPATDPEEPEKKDAP